MRLPAFILALLSVCLLALTGCSSDDHSNPVGPSGDPVAVSYYSSNFDAQASLPEWQVYLRGGTGSISAYIDSTRFLSPANGMAVGVSGSVFSDSLVYKPNALVASQAVWLDFDWLLASTTGEVEVVINQNAMNRASIGHNASGIFLTNNGVRHTVATPDPSVWHHVRMTLNPARGLSSYWLDGAPIGVDYTTAIVPIGAPTLDYLGVKLAMNPGDSVVLDNVQLYHY